MTRSLIVLAATATLAGAAEPTNLPANLTLNEALGIALNNSTAIRNAMTELDQATGRSTQSKSPLMPQLDLGLRQSLQTINLEGLGILIPNEASKLGPFGSMDARVFLQQQIFNLADRHVWKSVQARQDSSRLMVNNARELVALRVVAGYLDALKAKAARDTLSAQGKLATDLYNLTRDRVRQGVASELDAVRAMQQVNTLEQQQQESEHNYVATKLTLANLLQARITSDFEVSDNAAYGQGTPPDRDTAIKNAIAARPDYLAAEANLKAAELKVRSVKETRLPTLTFTASDGQSGSTPVHNVNTYRIQGGIDVPIFTGGRTKGEIEEAEGALHEAQVAIDGGRSQIETEVLDAISGVEWALKEVETSAANLKLSRQELDFSRSRFDRGITDNTEVVNAQDRLARADDANIRAQYMLGLARANLARAEGVAETTYHK